MSFLALALTLLPLPEKREQESLSCLTLREGKPQEDLLFFLLQPASQWPRLRMVACSEAGISTLSALLEQLVPGTLFGIAQGLYQVRAVESLSSAWAGVSTWDDFVQPPFGRSFHFSFDTPLVLSTPPGSLPEHVPDTVCFPSSPPVFAGLFQRWQSLGGPDLLADHEQLSGWLRDGECVVSDYALRGFPVVLSPEKQTVGFLGRILYTCRGETVALPRVLTALTRFAFFCRRRSLQHARDGDNPDQD